MGGEVADRKTKTVDNEAEIQAQAAEFMILYANKIESMYELDMAQGKQVLYSFKQLYLAKRKLWIDKLLELKSYLIKYR